MSEMPATGYVYFVRADKLRLIKIGYAADLDARMASMRAHSPDRVFLLGQIAHPTPKTLERELHIRFAKYREHGEWFRPGARLLAYIRSNAKLPFAATPWAVPLQEVYGEALTERWIGLAKEVPRNQRTET